MFLKDVEPGEIKNIINNIDIQKASDIFDITRAKGRIRQNY